VIRVILIALLGWLSNAQSQPPSPRPAKPAQENKNQPSPKQSESTTNQQPSEDIPALTDKVITELARRNQQQTAGERKKETSIDWWGIFRDALLVIFTGALAVLANRQHQAMIQQADYMRDALAETKKSADAAVNAATVAKRSLEVAYQAKVGITSITLTDPWAMARTVDDNATLSRCCVEMILINTGSTMARNFSFEYLIDIDGLEGVINPPAMIHRDPTDLHPSVPFQKMSLPIHGHFPDANVLWRYAVEGRNLTVSGHFSYWDIFGNQFRAGYFGKISNPPNPFMNPIAIPFEVNTETNPQE
jgi:hypothetical protein